MEDRLEINCPNGLKSSQSSNIFFCFFLITYFFGGLLYDFLGVNIIDEALVAILFFGFVIQWTQGRVVNSKNIAVVLFVSSLYICYSFIIKSNIPKAILIDFASQIKPYLAFFCTISLLPRFSKMQKKILSFFCWIVFAFMFIIALIGPSAIEYVFSHPSRFATFATINSFLFLYSNKLSRTNVIKFLLILAVGFFSGRSKFYGYYAFTVILSYLMLINYKFKISIKSLILGLLTLGLVAYFTKDKIQFYFIDGFYYSDQAFARPILYMISFQIFKDYFPLGSGLASFGSDASGKYYSNLYYDYEIDSFWGLTPENPAFVSDTFYPTLSQFGIVGLVIFFMFFFSMQRNISRTPTQLINHKLLIMLGIGFFFIESIADSTFTQNRGMIVLLIMALSYSEITLEHTSMK